MIGCDNPRFSGAGGKDVMSHTELYSDGTKFVPSPCVAYFVLYIFVKAHVVLSG